MQIPVKRKVFVETLGCQMNFSDSELMLGLLHQEGFEPTPDPAEADLLIINTCQIRGSAEDKAYSHLGRWRKYKLQNPSVRIAMAGCVAQQAKESVFKRLPHVDIVFGTQNIHDLPNLVRAAFSTSPYQPRGPRSKQGAHVMAVDRQKPRSTYDYVQDVTAIRDSDISAWVTVIEGCDYFCTYCVVPYTRGRQVSRQPDSILQEISQLAERGFKEVTLLGQTVDAYGKDFTDRRMDFADLLHALNDISGLERIRFMTSHPLDLNDRIIQAVADLSHVMEYIHIPMQSGDDEILERMRRGYTTKQYYDLVEKIYETIPNVAVTGDYIVGFPGETEAQFQNTVQSVRRSGIHLANTAAYSPRQQTPASFWELRGEAIPEEIKQERLAILNEAIAEQSRRINQRYQDEVVEVLVEGSSKRNDQRLTGRTRNNKVVNFDAPVGEDALIGQLVHVKITQTLPFSFIGHLAEEPLSPPINATSQDHLCSLPISV